MFRKLGPDSELGKQVSAFIAQKKEQNMEKIFTEEQYKAITDCFDKLRQDYTYGLLNSFLVDKLQQELSGTVNTKIYWPEIVAIANPITREWAHDQFVEKEKKYYWKSKNKDNEGDPVYITDNDYGVVKMESFNTDQINEGRRVSFTKKEIIKWGYNPDMFEREEVE